MSRLNTESIKNVLMGSALTLCLALSQSAHAAVTSPEVKVKSTGKVLNTTTGTTTCDLDPSMTDLTVCTNSVVQYTVEFDVDNLGDAPITVVSKIPTTTPDGRKVVIWETLPATCNGAGSGISADGLTLTCVIAGPLGNTGRLIYPFDATVLPTAKNGDSIPSPTTTVSSANVTQNATDKSGKINIVAKPRYDLEKVPGSTASYPGPNGEDGVLLSYAVSVKVPIGPEGIENVTTPLVITDTVPPNARLLNWNPASTPANPQSALPGCAPNGTDFPGVDITAWGLPGSIGTINSDSAALTTNGGTCTVTQSGGAGTPVTMTISGANLTTNTYPSKSVGNSSLTATDHYVTVQMVLLWVPMSAMTAGIVNPETNEVAFKMAPVSISGQNNTDPNSNNQTAQLNVPYYLGPGYFRKTWVNRSANETVLEAGDGRQVPGAKVMGEVLYVNTTVQPTQAVLCDKFDNTRFTLDSSWVDGVGSRNPADFVIEYGVGGKDSVGKAWASENDMKSSLCDDSQGPWYSALGSVPGGKEAVTKIRLRPRTGATADQTSMLGGQGLNLRYYLTVRDTYAYDSFASDGMAAGKAGETIPTGERLVNWSAYRLYGATDTLFGPYGKQDAAGNWWARPLDTDNARDSTGGDQLYLVRGLASSRKSVVPDNVTSVLAGSNVRYQVQPVLSTLVASSISTSVTLRDILPPGLSYVANSATVNPTNVQTNTPATGYTTLTWTLNNVLPGTDLPKIEFEAQVDGLVQNNHVLPNFVTTSSPADPTSTSLAGCSAAGIYQYMVADGYSIDPVSGSVSGITCRMAARRDIRVSNPGGLRLDKAVSSPEIPVGGDIVYTLKWGGISSTVDNSDFIDVLPYNGDGRSPASNFSGTVQLKNLIGTIDNDGNPASTVYYTSAAPASINRNPADNSNAIGGSGTVWCTSAQFGTSACPADKTKVTAFRIISTATQNQDVVRSVSVTLTTTGNKPNDVYSNEYKIRGSVNGSPLTQPVSSNTVVTKVLSPKLTVDKARDAASAYIKVSTNSDTGAITSYSPAQIKYTLTITNNGTSPANDLHLIDSLPASLTYDSFTVVSGPTPTLTKTGQKLDFLYSSLPASSSASVQVIAKVATLPKDVNQSTIDNFATLQGNGTDLTSTTVKSDVIYPRLTKQVRTLPNGAWGTIGQGLPGDILEYCITAHNYSTVPLANFVLSDPLPEHTTYEPNSATATLGQASEASGKVTDIIDSLPAKTDAEMCFKVKVN